MGCRLVVGEAFHGFLETGYRGIYFKGTEEVSATFEGNKQTKKMLGNMEPRKTNFQFLGNKQVYFSPPPPPVRASMVSG